MSKQIDLNKKLSEEDRKYLEDRDQWRAIRDNVERFGGRRPVLPGEPPQTGPESAVVQLGPTAVPPEEQAKYDEAQREQEASGASTSEDVAYEDMTVEELKAELDSRKTDAATDEERANLDYKSRENKEALIARLEKDDELVDGRP